MTIYADTSLVVAAYTAEVMSEPARTSLAGLADQDLRSSWWCETEIASALATKVRTGQMTERARHEASSAIESLLRQSATILPVGAHHFNAATALLERSTLVLRASERCAASCHRRGRRLCVVDP